MGHRPAVLGGAAGVRRGPICGEPVPVLLADEEPGEDPALGPGRLRAVLQAAGARAVPDSGGRKPDATGLYGVVDAAVGDRCSGRETAAAVVACGAAFSEMNGSKKPGKGACLRIGNMI